MTTAPDTTHDTNPTDTSALDAEIDNISHDDIVDMMRHDLESGRRIRPLTKREREIYGHAAMRATTYLPAFTSAIALLRPFVDASAETCYVDKYGRVGLSYFFLYAIDWNTRVTWLTHESMHVLNSHFVRAERENINPREMNICGDLEINTTLSTTYWANTDNMLLPELFGYEKLKTLEYYHNIREEQDEDAPQPQGSGDGKPQEGKNGQNQDSGNDSGSGSNSNSGSGQGGSSSDSSDNNSAGGSGQGGSDDGSSTSNNAPNPEDIEQQIQDAVKSFVDDITERLRRDMEAKAKGPGGSQNNGNPKSSQHSCDSATDARSDEADDADIERNSDSAQEIARQDTRARISQEIENNRMRGRSGAGNMFFEQMLNLMSPPKVDWRQIFRNAVARSYADATIGKNETSYRRVNRRYSQGKVIFPGTIDINPTALIAVDTSGSMGTRDYQSALIEVQNIVEKVCRARSGVPVCTVDTNMSELKRVRNVKDIELVGGGGTDMSIPFKYVKDMPSKKRPDITILCTDGYIFWDEVIDALKECPSRCIILMTNAMMDSVPQEAHLYAKIIPIGEENT